MLERRARLDQIDDEIGEADQRRELDRAADGDDLGRPAAAGEVLAGEAGVLGRDARHRRGGGGADGPGDHQAAAAEAEIERLVEVVGALAQHVAPADADVGRAVIDVGRHVVGLEQKEAQRPVVALAHQATIIAREGVDAVARPREERGQRPQEPALGQGHGERRGPEHQPAAPLTRSMSAPSARSFFSMLS